MTVIGSGVMGGIVAATLAKAGKNVILLEAGPRVNRREKVETYRNAPVKLSLANAKLQGAGSPFPSLPHAPSTYGDYLQYEDPVKYNTSYLRVIGEATVVKLPNGRYLFALINRAGYMSIGSEC